VHAYNVADILDATMLSRKYALIQIGNARGNANGWKKRETKSEKDRKERYSSELNGR